jgi:MoaA/NifB/PqqE/SkfB family radical SAM enzyme
MSENVTQAGNTATGNAGVPFLGKIEQTQGWDAPYCLFELFDILRCGTEAPMPTASPRSGHAAAEPGIARREPAHSHQVSGMRKAAAAGRVIARVVWLALRTYRNPARTARVLARLAADLRHWPTTSPGRTRFWTSHKCVESSDRFFWDFYVPGFPSRAFDRSIFRELDRIDPVGRRTGLQTSVIAITKRCSLACEHCFEGDVLNQPEALSLSQLRQTVERMRSYGTAQIFFSGGEPLQRFGDLVTLAAEAAVEADVWVLSSGRGLTADRARRLAVAGVTGVALSLDHWDPAAHDRFRGAQGTFEAVQRAALHARDAGLLVALSLCPTRAFVTEDNLRRYGQAARGLGASFIQILEPQSVGRYAGQDVALTPAQQRLLEQFCDRLNTDDRVAGLPNVRYLNWSARAFGCAGAGDRYLYIDTDGDAHACPFCRTPGVRVLDQNLDAAIAQLQTAGCGAYCQGSVLTARATS